MSDCNVHLTLVGEVGTFGGLVRLSHPTKWQSLRPPYSPQAAKASLKARSPGAPFSMAMMARRWLT